MTDPTNQPTHEHPTPTTSEPATRQDLADRARDEVIQAAAVLRNLVHGPTADRGQAEQDLEAKDAELGQAYAELNRLQVERDAEQGAFVAVTAGRDRLYAAVSGVAAVAEGALADPSMDRDYVLRRLAETARAALQEAPSRRTGDEVIQPMRALRQAVGQFRQELGGLEPSGPTAALLRAVERAVRSGR